jgi:hypothetical protein
MRLEVEGGVGNFGKTPSSPLGLGVIENRRTGTRYVVSVSDGGDSRVAVGPPNLLRKYASPHFTVQP